MRVILLTHGGAEILLERLNELEDIDIVGIFFETAATPQRSIFVKLRRSIKYDGVLETARKFFVKTPVNTTGSADKTVETAEKLGFTVFKVDDFHSAATIELMRQADADLGVIYGTNIIKEKVFSIPRLGSINLHQGLTPYYRGGPPVFWEIFNDEKEIGVTVHFVAATVDTGDIILQKTLPLAYDFTHGSNFEQFISDFQAGLRPESATMVAESVNLIASGKVRAKPQDTSVGKRYRLPVKKEKDEMRRRLRQRIDRGKNAKS